MKKKNLVCHYCKLEKKSTTTSKLGFAKICNECYKNRKEIKKKIIKRNKFTQNRLAKKELNTLGYFIDNEDGYAKLKAKIRNIKRKYNLEYDEYLELKERCNNRCEICNKKENISLAIDHCHKTEKVRGLLCSSCNIGLGGFKDNINLLLKAIEYLKTKQHN